MRINLPHNFNGNIVDLLTDIEQLVVQTDMPAKIDAQLRGLGAGFLPTCLAHSYIDSGRLVVKSVERAEQQVQTSYAWRKSGKAGPGKALQWWLDQLQAPVTRSALLGGVCGAASS